MSTLKPTVGQDVCYFAEPNSKTEAFSGPYPARVTVVLESAKAGDEVEQRVDLVVRFSEATEHHKTRVLVLEEARKHCCTVMPEGRSYEGWFEEQRATERDAAVQTSLPLDEAGQ